VSTISSVMAALVEDKRGHAMNEKISFVSTEIALPG
jgi:hypothetical protein